jgi:hypothetical protein
MYSWDEDPSTWYGKAKYSYSPAASATRDEAATRAKAYGPRTYEGHGGPNEAIIAPNKRIRSESKHPLIIAVDVTGSMAQWPAEIFDRLPLLFNTLAQYREDLQICFAAIGDAGCDRWPLQVTTFASGFDLEQLLGSLYGEGGGGDAPESYGLFAHWVNTHVEVPAAEPKPFLIVFGDITMHPKVPRDQIRRLLGDTPQADVDSLAAWKTVGRTWNTWFLRRPTGKPGDEVDQQWGQAIGERKILHIEDEQRAVDYAMALVARAWGRMDDFRKNMLGRQSEDKVEALSKPIEMRCPMCGGPVPVRADHLFKCEYCGMTLKV